jgi:hypothetical protein
LRQTAAWTSCASSRLARWTVRCVQLLATRAADARWAACFAWTRILTRALGLPQPLDDALPGAYVTVLGTPDYLPGVRVLVRSQQRRRACSTDAARPRQAHALRQHGAAYPLVVLLPRDLPAGVEQPLLDDAAQHGGGPNGSFSVSVQRVQRLLYAPGWTTAGCRYWWLNAAGHYAELEQSLNKLWVFSLTRFAVVVYLDADVLPLAAPDELFALAGAQRRMLRVGVGSESARGARVHAHAAGVQAPLFAAAPDWGRHGGDAPGFNAGVFVVTPCDGLLQELQKLAASAEHAHNARCHRRGTADQPLLQYYFGLDTFGLPMRYNMLQPGLRARPRLGDAYPPVLLHFTKVKPWAARGDSAVSAQPGMSEWAAVCDDISCCDQPGACGPRPDLLPRGPHFRRQDKAAGRRALP